MVEKEFVMSFERYSNNINESRNDNYLNEMGDVELDGEEAEEIEGEVNEAYAAIEEINDDIYESDVNFIEDLADDFALMGVNESAEYNWVLPILEQVVSATTVEELDAIEESIEDYDFLFEAEDGEKKGGIVQKIKDMIANKKAKMLEKNQSFKDAMMKADVKYKDDPKRKQAYKANLLKRQKKEASIFKIAIENLRNKIRKLLGKQAKASGDKKLMHKGFDKDKNMAAIRKHAK